MHYCTMSPLQDPLEPHRFAALPAPLRIDTNAWPTRRQRSARFSHAPGGPNVLLCRAISLLFFVCATAGLAGQDLYREPHYTIDAGGPVKRLEEAIDGVVTTYLVLDALDKPREYRRLGDNPQRFVWTYTGSGRSVDEFKGGVDGSWTLTIRYNYAGERLSTTEGYDAVGRVVERRNYRYAQDGRIALETVTDAGGAATESYRYVYPGASLTEKWADFPDGKSSLLRRLRRDDVGRTVEDAQYTAKGLSSRRVFSYDVEGGVSGVEEYDYRNVISSTTAYGFNARGAPTSIIRFSRSGKIQLAIFYRYVVKGGEEQVTITDHKGEVAGEILIHRNSDGKIDERRESTYLPGSRMIDTRSDYDRYGNWHRKEIGTFLDGGRGGHSTYVRTIEYF